MVCRKSGREASICRCSSSLRFCATRQPRCLREGSELVEQFVSFHLQIALNRSLMRSRCREDMQFGIICLRSQVDPLSFGHFHAGRALELVEQSRLKSNTLFATFVSEATDTPEYRFDGSVASFQENREQALKMFGIALGKPVKLDLLLEELQTISEGGKELIMCDLHLIP